MWKIGNLWPGSNKTSGNPIVDIIRSVEKPLERYSADSAQDDGAKIFIQEIHESHVTGYARYISGQSIHDIPFIAKLHGGAQGQAQGVFCEAINDDDSFWILGESSAGTIINHLQRRFMLAEAIRDEQRPGF